MNRNSGLLLILSFQGSLTLELKGGFESTYSQNRVFYFASSELRIFPDGDAAGLENWPPWGPLPSPTTSHLRVLGRCCWLLALPLAASPLQLSTVSSMFTVSLSASRALKDGGRLHRVGSQGNKSDSQCGELGFTALSISLRHIVLDPKLAAWAVPNRQMILSQTPPQPGV